MHDAPATEQSSSARPTQHVVVHQGTKPANMAQSASFTAQPLQAAACKILSNDADRATLPTVGTSYQLPGDAY